MNSKIKGLLLGIGMLLCLGSGGFLPNASAAASAQPASVWRGSLYAEGQPVGSLLSADNVELPIIIYQGSTYFPLRSAGELTGKKVAWDAATNTASFSGNTERIYQDSKDRISAIPEDGKLTVNPASEIKITVDGKAVALKDANGKPVYPLLYADSIYVPLRSVGELTGNEVTWAGNSDGIENIYIRTPLTNAQIQAANTYIYAQIDHLVALHDLANQLKGTVLTETLRTKAVAAMSSELDKMKAETCPKVAILLENDKNLRIALENAIQTVERMRNAPISDVSSIAVKNFRYTDEVAIYIPMLNMKMTLDQKAVVMDSKFLEYSINR